MVSTKWFLQSGELSFFCGFHSYFRFKNTPENSVFLVVVIRQRSYWFQTFGKKGNLFFKDILNEQNTILFHCSVVFFKGAVFIHKLPNDSNLTFSYSTSCKQLAEDLKMNLPYRLWKAIKAFSMCEVLEKRREWKENSVGHKVEATWKGSTGRLSWSCNTALYCVSLTHKQDLHVRTPG